MLVWIQNLRRCSSPNLRIKWLLKSVDWLYKQWMCTDWHNTGYLLFFSHSPCECTIIVIILYYSYRGEEVTTWCCNFDHQWLWTPLLYWWGHSNTQLFALIEMRDSVLLNVRDAFLINGKRCIYILVSGTRYSYVKVTGAQSWLHSVTSPVVFPLGWLLQIRLSNDWLIN